MLTKKTRAFHLPDPFEPRSGICEFADEREDFAAFKFAWIAWPERHFIIPVKKCSYVPATKSFDLTLDYRPGRLDPDPKKPDMPPKFRARHIPKPFAGEAVERTRKGLKTGLQDVYIGVHPDRFSRKIVWLIPEKEQLLDGQIPAKRLEFSADFMGSIQFSETPPSELTDMNGPCEAKAKLTVTGPIAKYGDWTPPVSLGKKILDIIDVGVALGALAISQVANNAAEDAALAAKSGRYVSSFAYPALFDAIVRFIRNNPLGPGTSGQLLTDADAMTITITYQWVEPNLSLGMPDMNQRLDLHLTFQPTESGTVTNYEWVDYNFPRGLKAGQNIKIVNTWIRNIANRPN